MFEDVWRLLRPCGSACLAVPRGLLWQFSQRDLKLLPSPTTHWDHWAFQVAWLIDDQSMVGGLDGNPWVTNSHHWKWIKWMNMSQPRTCREDESGRSKGSESQLWLKAQDVGCLWCRSRRQTRMPCAEPCATQFHSQRVLAWTSWQFLTFSLQHCRLVWKVLRSDICCAQCTCRTRHSSEGGHDAITALVITCYHHEWQYTSDATGTYYIILNLIELRQTENHYHWPIRSVMIETYLDYLQLKLSLGDWAPGACASDVLVCRKQLPGPELHSCTAAQQGGCMVLAAGAACRSSMAIVSINK